MTSILLASAVSAFMVSIVKPLLVFVTFVPWAWVISSKLDKDAVRLHLPRDMFNLGLFLCRKGLEASQIENHEKLQQKFLQRMHASKICFFFC